MVELPFKVVVLGLFNRLARIKELL